MAHARKQLRDAVAALIGTNPGVTVQASRAYPMSEAEMPRYLVYTTAESVDEGASTRDGIMRTVEMVIEAVAVATESDVDDVLDAHAVYLETVLNGSTIGGLALKTELRRSQITTDVQGDIALGILTLTYDVIYRTLPTNPEIFA